MTCKRCNSELPENSRFCMACGALQPMICPSCQAESRPGSRSCSACGKKLPVGEGTVKFYKKKRTPSQIAAMALLTLGAVLVVVAAVMFLMGTFRDVTVQEQPEPEQGQQLQLELIVEEPVRREEDSAEEPSVEEEPEEETPETEVPAEDDPEKDNPAEEERTEEEPVEDEPEQESTVSEWFFPDSSERLLTEADIAGMSSAELQIARNEIFARHGRRFNNPDLQAWFDSCSWYNGTIAPNDFDQSIFNATELENIRFLKAAE